MYLGVIGSDARDLQKGIIMQKTEQNTGLKCAEKEAHKKQQRLLVPDPLLQFYRVPAAAAMLGIDRVTLYAKVKRGELPPFQSVGGIKGYSAERIRSIYQPA